MKHQSETIFLQEDTISNKAENAMRKRNLRPIFLWQTEQLDCGSRANTVVEAARHEQQNAMTPHYPVS